MLAVFRAADLVVNGAQVPGRHGPPGRSLALIRIGVKEELQTIHAAALRLSRCPGCRRKGGARREAGIGITVSYAGERPEPGTVNAEETRLLGIQCGVLATGIERTSCSEDGPRSRRRTSSCPPPPAGSCR